MTERPARCPFCSNTDLLRVDDIRWSCVGSLGCGGVWDPTVIVAAPPRLDRAEEPETERPRPALPLRPTRKLLRRRPFRLTDAA
jgi:hypothetical protein